LKVSHLFLDLDGTLTDPREGITRSIAHALSALHRPVPALESLARFIGPPLAQSFGTLLGTTDEVIVRSAVHAYRGRFSSTGILENRVYPDIPHTLAVLAGRGFRLYIATSKPTVYAKRIVEHFGLARYFAAIYGPSLDDLNVSKTSLVRGALEAEGLDCATVAMVGDRKEDVLAGKANGVKAVGVTWGYGTPAELVDADQLVHSPTELVSWLVAV
jgi:phosphoglycolate phosphatase